MTSSRNDRPEAAVVVGRQPAREAIASGRATRLLVAQTVARSAPVRRLVEDADARGVEVRQADPREIERVARGALHQGVVALVRLPDELTEGDLARRSWPEEAVALVLDGVTDPQNLGAAARTAEAAGASLLVIRRHRGAGLGPAAIKASAGALLHLPVARVANVGRALGRLQEAGFWVIGLDGAATSSVMELEPPPGRLALVAGAEGAGISRLVREACDELAAIPMRGRVGSLNVSVAAGVALYALLARKN